MKKVRKLVSVLMLAAAVVFAAGCTKPDEPNNGGGNNGGGNNGGADSNAPTGSTGGVFTINANGDKVYFSKGNLQYQASTKTWRFAEQQWESLIDANRNISSTYDGWIDLFGWGTSSWNNGNVYYQPYDYDFVYDRTDCGYGYGPTDGIVYTLDLKGAYAKADWGIYNPITNGGNQSNLWRTLTEAEWDYLLKTRSTTSGIRYAHALVNNIGGLILLPDNWDASNFSFLNADSYQAEWTSNTVSESEWNRIFKPAGAVFLPVTGERQITGVYNQGMGFYWSSVCYGEENAYSLQFSVTAVTPTNYTGERYTGRAVRLVQVAQ
jgi:hypothetical protein